MDWLKMTHVTAVSLSLTGFVLRGIGMMLEARWMESRWVRRLPHYIDTVLLLSALLLAWRIAQYPFVHAWLSAKVIALLGYIGLGMVALHYGETRLQRILSWCAALACFGYIVLVAMYKTPLPW